MLEIWEDFKNVLQTVFVLLQVGFKSNFVPVYAHPYVLPNKVYGLTVFGRFKQSL